MAVAKRNRVGCPEFLRLLTMDPRSFLKPGLPPFWKAIAALFLLLPNVAPLQAQLPVCRLQTVFPAGGRAGTSVEVALAGTDLDETRQLLVSNTNLAASLKPNSSGDKFVIAISSNTPPGRYEVRAVGRFGVSNPRIFAVDTVPEMVIPPTNTTGAAAVEVPQANWINGWIEVGTYAYFHFQAEKGQRLLIECLDSQIDSRLDASLVLYDEHQREVARNRRGGLLDYSAPGSGMFTLRLNDFLFRGGSEYFYRLLASTRPHLDFVFPPSALPGTTNKHVLYGRNLPGAQPSHFKTPDGGKLDELPVEVSMPKDITSGRVPNGSLDANLADAAVDSIEYQVASSNGLSNPVLISAATAPVIMEQHSSKTNCQLLTVPCEVAGQFYPADDRDWYSFEAKKGDVYWIEAFSQRLGVPSDPFVLVQRVTKNSKGEEQLTDVKELGDSEANFGGAEYKTSSLDPAWRFAVSETGTYRIQVRDLFSRSKTDPRLVYRLSIRTETPDFRLVATPLAQAPPKKDSKDVTLWSMVLRKGQILPYRVLVVRQDNFSGEITLNTEGLPPFITCPSVTVPSGANSALLFFNATTNSTDWAGSIRIIGRAKVGEKDLVREARGATLNWTVADNTLEPAKSRLTQGIALSVCASEPTPVQVFAGDGKAIEAATNSKVKIPVKILRSADWTPALKLKPSGSAALSALKELEVDGKTSTASLELDVAKLKLAPGTYSFYLQSEAQGKYQNNAEGAKRAAAEAKDWEKKAADLAVAAKKAAEALKAAAKTALDSESASKTALEKLASAKSAAEQDNAPEPAKAAQAAAEKAATRAGEKAKAARETKAAAEKILKDAEAKSKDAEARKQAAANRAKELADKAKAKDATIYVYSTPVQVKVVAKTGK
ncbi:MAG: peptidase domain protein [Verrucomicrobiales bacterium]|nr:peptidase domain protein [Verrucomicrobiales bacterium]